MTFIDMKYMPTFPKYFW